MGTQEEGTAGIAEGEALVEHRSDSGPSSC